jgi:serine/threonine protein kinase
VTAEPTPLPSGSSQEPRQPDRLTIPPNYALRRRYRLGPVIARGGMSTVYRATDTLRVRARAAECEVAVKVVDLIGPSRPDAIELIHREARRMRELAHPNIVRVFDSDVDGPYHFIVMELLAGQTLSQRLRAGGVERADVLSVIGPVADALDCAHAAGVVHGDLKPGNIFLTARGEVKLLDFGLAFAVRAVAADDEDPTIHYLARVGGLTPSFAAYEMLAGEPPSPASDVFALAVIAYILHAGRHPFDRRDAVAAKALGLVPERLPHLGRRAWGTMAAALSFDAAERPQRAGEFAAAFRPQRWWQLMR